MKCLLFLFSLSLFLKFFIYPEIVEIKTVRISIQKGPGLVGTNKTPLKVGTNSSKTGIDKRAHISKINTIN